MRVDIWRGSGPSAGLVRCLLTESCRAIIVLPACEEIGNLGFGVAIDSCDFNSIKLTQGRQQVRDLGSVNLLAKLAANGAN